MNRKMSDGVDELEMPSVIRSPDERKKVLWKTLSCALSLQERNESLDINDLRTLEEVLKEGNNAVLESSLYEKMKNQSEMFFDSEAINISSKIITKCTKSLTQNISSYNHIDFSTKILYHMLKLPDTLLENPDWSVLETEVTKYIKRVPEYTTLLGSLAPLEKKVINKRVAVNKSQAVMKSPENVVVVNKVEESVEETVDKIKKFIKYYYKNNEKPLDFFCLILNPNDFGKTIENMLYVSFLVRDGFIKLVKDDAGILVIQLCSKEMILQRKQTGTHVNIQNVMSINMEQWKVLKDVYKLERPMLDFRTKVNCHT
ncbi:PREDICTED: EP300-interacting inhibitor of differentiation 3 [Polistes dominula]|uniref:Non-structural maintenance of chromosomes element 4 n=1 Tax=Polistes dominula TaxID=743375 RepID=A0ABM1I9T9_POLDO|nr:PREDICTED: EP300-interacting inhibitor of differentiation 3 [Polistes dominula]XP_015176978.1 PREDICTED: EP300-interacting inhibitor of differentiation 3 [Polistes dominula]XP_015176979.1 PREDICTED: EP300-interacting inhibitor of differentiation 3 [Polistes dominula]